ncbi:MAG: twin-arginine translocase TatA/TatE family subunit [Solirubrobacteraceae bacterium]|nr:twin-arginine translocase TatA/TatE family subunit [Solirubrobacteraceae bacterium]
MPLGIGVPELLIILVILLVVFGPKRLPGLGKQLGTGLREFKDSINSKGDDDAETPSKLDAAPADRTTVTSSSESERTARS